MAAPSAPGKPQETDHNQQHRPRLRKAEIGEAIERKQHADRNQNDGAGDRADKIGALVVHFGASAFRSALTSRLAGLSLA
jgi:hypothetical protein